MSRGDVQGRDLEHQRGQLHVVSSGDIQHQRTVDTCLTCPVGSYCGSTGMSAPTACPPGTYKDVTGGTNVGDCTLCPAGKYRASTWASSLDQCLVCPVTQYGPKAGLSACTVCHAGLYADVTGLTVYAVCTVGSYQDSLPVCQHDQPAQWVLPAGLLLH